MPGRDRRRALRARLDALAQRLLEPLTLDRARPQQAGGASEAGDNRQFEPVARRPSVEDDIDAPVEVFARHVGARRAYAPAAVGGRRDQRRPAARISARATSCEGMRRASVSNPARASSETRVRRRKAATIVSGPGQNALASFLRPRVELGFRPRA